MPCFYTPNLKKENKKITIIGDEFHHLKNVFRKNIGEKILLTNGNGLLANAEIKNISKKEISVFILKIKEEKISEPKIAVAFALLKNKHDNLIVEKLTELGVKDFFPIFTERTVRKLSKNTVEKFEKAAISAIKQCDNAFLPKIHKTQTLEILINSDLEFQPILALELGKHQTISQIAEDIQKPLCIIIGPEGGFSNNEIEIFRQKEIPSFSLGNHILRAETAAIASVSQLLEYYLKENSEYY
ncbi:MAG TPA: 16S rRNA (uracil(1498)-N(3))-methyltransferase [Candidatus Cloacimonetes bacterium]|nr:16S rRNA (uracil(1498)-N(3))-methyltransferase [Candidatus Cloacimonadota bacterium]